MHPPVHPRNGAALVVVVLAMIAAGIVGTAILSKVSSARFERVQFSLTNRAYYLAESGAAYVRARADTEIDYPPPEGHPPITNTLANGDQFIVAAYRTNVTKVTVSGGVTNTSTSLHIMAESIGIANPGTALEARRQIHFDMLRKGMDMSAVEGQLTLFTGSTSKPDYNNDMFNESGTSKVEVKDTGPSQGIAVVPKVEKGDYVAHLALNWQDKPDLTNALLRFYQFSDSLLSYDVQMKPAYFPNVPSSHFMMGISFRLRPGSMYGLSFFHSETNSTDEYLAENVPWVPKLDANFSSLRGTNFYVVLWCWAASNAPIQLINSRRLPGDFLYLDKEKYELKYYSTLLLQLDETYTDPSKTNRENRIVAYLALTNNNPIWPNYHTTNAVWQENSTNFPASANCPILWDQNPYAPASGNRVTNIDSRLTSENFATIRNSEIGIHLFYDRNSNNENFFRDFAIRLGSYGSPVGGTQIQW